VLPALIRKFHQAKSEGQPTVTIWGSGRPRREFLHVDDLAEACMVVMKRYAGPEPINIGAGVDVTIAELATLVAEAVGYRGAMVFDPVRPDGTLRKLLDVTRIQALGWKPRIELRDGITETYHCWMNDSGVARRVEAQAGKRALAS
jgi:GDP-L-fucose synthase